MSVSLIMLTEGCKGKISEPENAAIQTEETINEADEIIPETEITQKPQIVQTKKIEKKQYEVQLLSSKNLKAVMNEKINLLKNGFKCKIVTKEMNGEMQYRLRHRDIFTLTDANNIGEEIVKRIPTVTGYWVQKVN
jgi:hypothetical protein